MKNSIPATSQMTEVMDDRTSGKDEPLAQPHDRAIGSEQAQIYALRRRLEDPQMRAEDLSKIIAEAIALRSKQDRKLQTTLQPLIEESLRISVARDPVMLATALFPIIAEAVRTGISHVQQGLFDSLNRVLDRAFSLESWKWRLEAWRSGTSYGEVALARSFIYRVEQVFLIHRKTGLLLGHVSSGDGVVQDADLVSGMLTALQDFVRDSFGPSKSDELEVMQVGEFKLWVQHGPLALLAAVVSGQPPPALRQVFARELETIHREFTLALQHFDGETDAIAGSEVHLQRCMLSAGKANTKRSYEAVWVAGIFVLLLIGIFAGLRIRDNRRWARYVERLQAEPGIVVIGAQRGWWGYSVRGLRDPMAADPQALLGEFRVPAQKVSEHWNSYLSSDPHLDQVRRLDGDKALLERQVIRFDLNSAQLRPDQLALLDRVQEEIDTLRQAADASRLRIQIVVNGHTDTGQEKHNVDLSRNRAETVMRALVERGIPDRLMVAAGLRDAISENDGAETDSRELYRRVTFQVTLDPPIWPRAGLTP